MFWRKLDKERDRYYLLPGQGGKRAVQRKRMMMLKWAIGVGLLLSFIFGALLYYLYRWSE